MNPAEARVPAARDRLAERVQVALTTLGKMPTDALAAALRSHLARQDVADAIPGEVLVGLLLAQIGAALSGGSTSATDRAAVWRILGASWASISSAANSGSLAPAPAAQDQAHVAEAAARGAASGAAIAGAAVADLVADAIARADRMARERAAGQQSVTIEGRAEPEPRVKAGLEGGVHLLGEQVHASPAIPTRLPEPVPRSADLLMDWRD